MKSQKFDATIENLKHIRNFVEQILIDLKINSKTVLEIKLAVGESIANIIKYGYKESDSKNKIFVEVDFKDNLFEIHIYDNGIKVTKDMIKHRDIDDVKPGQIGTYFIKNIMDYFDWSEEKSDWVNHLVLKKKIH
ncbi:ATP-binding protein [Candidatus Pelagibacter sp. HIMB1483]|uniref:ATP-binding protein n=1 Tax=Candidatus Pelagibacter sp. HIMB1483 TaxID=3415414 RepID=UPI003F8611C4